MFEEIAAWFKKQRNAMIKRTMTEEKLQNMTKFQLDMLGNKFDLNLDRRKKKEKLIAKLREVLELPTPPKDIEQ